MVSFGENIVINIGGVDHSININSTSESGGERKYATKKMIGNNYKKIEIGRENYNLIFNFKVEGIIVNTLFEQVTPITIIMAGIDYTITYYNMLPEGLTLKHDVDGFTEAELRYTAPAYDKANTRYNRVIS